jgi:ketosteroid isomerase-like protein
MIRRAASRAAAALVAVAVITAAATGARSADDPASAIRAALEQWRLDFNAGRSAHICDLFAPTLRYDFQGLPEQTYPLLCGRLHRALADPAKRFHYGLRIKEVIVSGSLAVVRLTWISTVTLTGGQTSTKDEPGLDVFRRQPDGRWTISRYIAYEEG